MHQLDVVYILRNKDFDQDLKSGSVFSYTQDWELTSLHKTVDLPNVKNGKDALNLNMHHHID